MYSSNSGEFARPPRFEAPDTRRQAAPAPASPHRYHPVVSPRSATHSSSGGQRSAMSHSAPSSGVPSSRSPSVPPGNWYYVDEAGKEQGPFSFEEMQTWYIHGYFKPTLMVKNDHSPSFSPLGSRLSYTPTAASAAAPTTSSVARNTSEGRHGSRGGTTRASLKSNSIGRTHNSTKSRTPIPSYQSTKSPRSISTEDVAMSADASSLDRSKSMNDSASSVSLTTSGSVLTTSAQHKEKREHKGKPHKGVRKGVVRAGRRVTVLAAQPKGHHHKGSHHQGSDSLDTGEDKRFSNPEKVGELFQKDNRTKEWACYRFLIKNGILYRFGSPITDETLSISPVQDLVAAHQYKVAALLTNAELSQVEFQDGLHCFQIKLGAKVALYGSRAQPEMKEWLDALRSSEVVTTVSKGKSEKVGFLYLKKKRVYAVLSQGLLTCFTNDYMEEKAKCPPINVTFCSPKMIDDVNKQKKRYTFHLLSAERTYVFAAESASEMVSWVKAIQECQARLMGDELSYSLDSGSGKKGSSGIGGKGEKKEDNEELKASRERLQQLLDLEWNRTCADCGGEDPIWLSLNLGVFMCIECSGVHRTMGTHISQVRSVTMDVLSDGELDFLQRTGNRVSNMFFEANMPRGVGRPKPDADPLVREQFIRAKYEHKAFARPGELREYVETL